MEKATPMATKRYEPKPPPLPATIKNTNKSSPVRRSCCASATDAWDRLFGDAYRADVSILTDGETIYAHSSILGFASPVFRGMFKYSRSKCPYTVPIPGVSPEAVRIFVRFLYTSCYEKEQMEEHVMSLLVLSHSFAVSQLKRECEYQLEHRLLNVDNVVDTFQLALLCDTPRLTIVCHRFILKSFKAASASAGWKAMRESHPFLEKELIESVIDEDNKRKEKIKKKKHRKIYLQLYEAMEALVHICRDGCRTIGPHDKVPPKGDRAPCGYAACKGLESLVRHFAGCKLRVSGGCVHCKRMWQLLELHSRICADSSICRVPLCRNFKHKIAKQNKKKKKKKDETMWRILVRKILRTKSITGGPYFTMAS